MPQRIHRRMPGVVQPDVLRAAVGEKSPGCAATAADIEQDLSSDGCTPGLEATHVLISLEFCLLVSKVGFPIGARLQLTEECVVTALESRLPSLVPVGASVVSAIIRLARCV